MTMLNENCCVAAPAEPKMITVREIQTEIDMNVTEALCTAMAMADALFGMKDEHNELKVDCIQEALLMTRDKAMHLRAVLTEISKRLGLYQ